MKKILEIIILILGSFILFVLTDILATQIGLRVFGWENLFEVFVTFSKFTLSLGFILLTYVIVWKPIYSHFDCSFKGAREAWEKLSAEKKFWYALAFLYVLVLLWGRVS